MKSGKVNKTKRVEEIVLNAFIPVFKMEIKDLLPDISITTIEKVLSEMLKDGRITKIGSTSKARYIKNRTEFTASDSGFLTINFSHFNIQ